MLILMAKDLTDFKFDSLRGRRGTTLGAVYSKMGLTKDVYSQIMVSEE